MKRVSLFAIKILLLFFMSGCSMPTISRTVLYENNPQEIPYAKESLTLEWDYYFGLPVNSYNFYYKNLFSSDWKLLDSTISSTAEFTIDYNQLGEGSWIFGVSAVGDEGLESEIHSSLDHRAIPITGWYINWELK